MCDFAHMPDSGHMRDSGHMLDSGQKMRLRSKDATSVVCLTPVRRCDFDCMSDSNRRSYRMSYLLVCERLCMFELDDCNILQCDHLDGNKLS
jgi:hypothetical protein